MYYRLNFYNNNGSEKTKKYFETEEEMEEAYKNDSSKAKPTAWKWNDRNQEWDRLMGY